MNNAAFLTQRALKSRQEELSVAALHAVVAQSGGAILPASHNADSMGVDVSCCFQGVFSSRIGGLTSTSLHVQLKASRSPKSVEKNGVEYWSLALPIDRLRRYVSWGSELILALFVLPSDDEESVWVEVDLERIVLRKSLYWTPLVGFPLDESKKTNVLHIPKSSLLTPRSLRDVVSSKVEGKAPRYVQPE